MFEFRIPVCTEKLFKNIDKSFREDLFRFSLFDGKRIETKWILFIGRVEYDYVIFPTLRNMHHHLFDEISMGIDDSDSFAVVDIIDHLSDEEFTLSDSGFSDDIGVAETILIIYPYGYTHTPIIRLSEYRELRIMRCDSDIPIFDRIWEYRHPDRKCEFFCIDLQECSFPSRILRKVVHPREFIRSEYEHFTSLFYDPMDIFRFSEWMDLMTELIEWRILKQRKVMEKSLCDMSRLFLSRALDDDHDLRMIEFL